MKCLRCDTEMVFFKKTEVQLSIGGSIGGDLGQWAEGTIPAEVYVCPQCRKIEFFSPEDKPPTVHCRSCGNSVSIFAGEICPVCGKKVRPKPNPANYIRPKNF